MPNYRLLRRIGQGSYGEVWLALDAMNKWAAVKVVWWRDEDDGRTYQREFAGLKRYDDLSVGDGWLMPIRNVTCDEERRFFSYAMELADDARTLAPLQRLANKDPAEAIQRAQGYQPRILSGELRRRGRLPPEEVLEIGLTLCQSVERLHAGNLLHRDIKPSNIIFVGGQPRLADIGLVAAADATLPSFAGTSGFVPLQGAGSASGDIFALGKVLYLMATGNRVEDFPKVSEDFSELEDAERTRLAELQAVFDRACEPEPRDRQPTAKVLRAELELLRENESVLYLRELEGLEARRRERWRRRRIGMALSLPLAVIGLGFLGLWIRQQSIRHRALVAELERRQLFRNGERLSGWSRTDWVSAQRAVAMGRPDHSILRHAVGTLSGVDALPRAVWPNMEATDVAFSSEGHVILSGFGGSPAWLITEGTNRHQLPVSGEGKVAWSSHGVPLILQADTNALLLRDLRTGDVHRRFAVPSSAGEAPIRIGAMALSDDGHWVAAQFEGATEKRVFVWDTISGGLQGERALEAHCLAISPDQQHLAAGHLDGRVSLLRLPQLEVVVELPAVLGSSPVQALAFGRNWNVPLETNRSEFPWRLATGSRGTGIAVWDLSLPSPIAFCRGAAWEVQALAFSPDGAILASSGRVGVRLWDATTGQPMLYTDFPSSNTRALSFDRTGRLLFAGSTSESAPAETYLWALEPHRGVQSLRGLTTVVRKTAWSPDGRWLAALSDEWKLAVWDLASGRLTGCFEIPLDAYADSVGITFSEDGAQLAVASGHEVRVIHLATSEWGGRWQLKMGFGKEIRFLDPRRLRVAFVEVSQDPSRPRQWAVYELDEGAPARLVRRQNASDPETMNVIASPDGRRLLVMAWDESRQFNHVRYVDLETGGTVWSRRTQGSDGWSMMRMDPQGQWGAFRNQSQGPTEIVSLANGQTLFEMTGITRMAALSPVESWCVVPGNDPGSFADTLSLRRMDEPDDALPLGTDGRSSLDTVAFSRDGRQVAWGCIDGTVAVAEINQVRLAIAQFLNSAPHAGKVR